MMRLHFLLLRPPDVLPSLISNLIFPSELRHANVHQFHASFFTYHVIIYKLLSRHISDPSGADVLPSQTRRRLRH